MKNVFAAFTLTLLAGSAVAQDLPRPSPKATVTQQVGLSEVTITYSRPSVRGRTIWGGLVPYDRVWRTGANEQTIIRFSDDATINGEKIAAGTYSLHSIPAASEWTLIFNRAANPAGNYSYDAASDALRIRVQPRASEHVEMMTFAFPVVNRDDATIVLQWEKVEVPFTVRFDTIGKTLASIDRALAELKADDWRTPYRAADFAFQNSVGDALTWVNRSVAAQPTVANLTLQARVLAKTGRKKEAIAAAERAIALGRAANPPADTSALEKELATWRK